MADLLSVLTSFINIILNVIFITFFYMQYIKLFLVLRVKNIPYTVHWEYGDPTYIHTYIIYICVYCKYIHTQYIFQISQHISPNLRYLMFSYSSGPCTMHTPTHGPRSVYSVYAWSSIQLLVRVKSFSVFWCRLVIISGLARVQHEWEHHYFLCTWPDLMWPLFMAVWSVNSPSL